jgi:hypothetical protein
MCICRTPALAAVVAEAMEIFCDKAEAILREALESEHEESTPIGVGGGVSGSILTPSSLASLGP